MAREGNAATERRGDELIDRLCAADDVQEARGPATHELLMEIFAGYPVENLRRLLQCDGPAALDAAAAVLSELGPRAAPMIGEIAPILEHSSEYARFYAVDAVHASATGSHGAVIAKALTLVADPDKRVRWKVLHFLSWATEDQLAASLPFLGESRIGGLTAWLASVKDESQSVQEILAGLEGADGLSRLFATAAAVRLKERIQVQVPLEYAAASTDEEISSFAKEELAAPRRRPR